MIADYADKLNTYEEFKDYADMVQQFIKKQKEENLPEGRYDLKNGIFALVQKYTTKSLDPCRTITSGHLPVHRWNPIRNTVTFSTL